MEYKNCLFSECEACRLSGDSLMCNQLFFKQCTFSASSDHTRSLSCHGFYTNPVEQSLNVTSVSTTINLICGVTCKPLCEQSLSLSLSRSFSLCLFHSLSLFLFLSFFSSLTLSFSSFISTPYYLDVNISLYCLLIHTCARVEIKEKNTEVSQTKIKLDILLVSNQLLHLCISANNQINLKTNTAITHFN